MNERRTKRQDTINSFDNKCLRQGNINKHRRQIEKEEEESRKERKAHVRTLTHTLNSNNRKIQTFSYRGEKQEFWGLHEALMLMKSVCSCLVAGATVCLCMPDKTLHTLNLTLLRVNFEVLVGKRKQHTPWLWYSYHCRFYCCTQGKFATVWC